MHDLVIRGGTVVDGTGAPPRTADVAIDGTQIVEVGAVGTRGKQEIDADGAIVAPGWVDVHTHYDGQATWDPDMQPSVDHGVTTVIMGNCGVGFAPVRPDGKDFLIELMESVEDIPGTALHEGMSWDWESFGEYLTALSSMHRTMDVGTQVPHCAVRAYVLGERAHDNELTAAEYQQMAELVAQGVRDGGFGFSTSRTILHRSRHGYIPGTFAPDDELAVIADALAGVGRGLFQYVSDDGAHDPGELAWLHDLSAKGVPVTYSLAQSPFEPDAYRNALATAAAHAEGGATITPQVAVRPTGLLFGLRSSFHPFMAHPSYRPLWELPLAAKVAKLRDPEFRAQLLDEEPHTTQKATIALATAWHQMYELGAEPDYEPLPETSAQAIADREGRRPQEVVLDWLLKDDGKAFMFSPLGNYVHHDHEAIRELLAHPNTVVGLGDGGAHCGLICDASFPTYMLTHWTRDRTRGEKLPIELVVHKYTQGPARTYSMPDRGSLEPGMLADVNVIDHENLTLHGPRMVHDLPAGGKRLLQDVDGYLQTIKAGQVTMVDGELTGARPGRTLRATDTGVDRI
ncbi:MAG: amidohydrolase family protein [Acidimicrobiales bacterium]|nr:amidohydrolase family protein [Acidimicrobiales bacterium]